MLKFLQVIVGSFIYGGSKARSKTKTIQEQSVESDHSIGDKQTPSNTLPNQNLTPSVMGGWPGSRQIDIRNAHIDIDLTRG